MERTSHWVLMFSPGTLILYGGQTALRRLIINTCSVLTLCGTQRCAHSSSVNSLNSDSWGIGLGQILPYPPQHLTHWRAHYRCSVNVKWILRLSYGHMAGRQESCCSNCNTFPTTAAYLQWVILLCNSKSQDV